MLTILNLELLLYLNMELLYKGHSLFLADEYHEACLVYESATNCPETACEAFTSWAYALIKLGDLKQAASKAENAIQINPSNPLSFLRKAQALFYEQHFSASLELFLHANTLKPNIADSWITKCESELKNIVIKEPFTWFQSQEEVHLIFFVKTNSPEDVKLEINSNSVTITAKTTSGSEFLNTVQLLHEILPTDSRSSIKSNKVEVILKKSSASIWHTLEPTKQETSKPSYPSSSKKAKNWDKLNKEFDEELKKDKPEGEAALNELFKQIYENADEDTRRAMIKSYQTSGGTVLSTNWGEVKEKDYEGKDRPDPPKGQQWVSP